MNQKNDKEILFRGDPIVQIMATPHPGNKIIYLNEEAINEVKSFSEELSLLEVSDLVLSKLSEKPANIKFLAAIYFFWYLLIWITANTKMTKPIATKAIIKYQATVKLAAPLIIPKSGAPIA